MNAATILTALFNGAWQGALLCGAAILALRLLRRSNATTMFAIWSVLLAICIALPFLNYAFAAHPYTVSAPASKQQTHNYVVTGDPHIAALPAVKHWTEKIVVTSAGPAEEQNLQQRALDMLAALMARAWMLLVLLGAIAAVRLALLARDIAVMMHARRTARRIDAPVRARLRIKRPYAFAASSTLTSPCVLGFSPALIVIPEDLLESKSGELLSVVLHEAEHVRRFDDVQNVVHRAIWAVAFFCPGIRIALRELALYREQICDDAAVNGLGDAVTYARTLTGLAQWAQGRGVPVPSLIFKRKHLLQRLEVLLDGAANHSLHINRRSAFAVASAMMLCALIVVRVQLPVIAQVAAPPPLPAPVAAPAALPSIAPVPPKVRAKAAATAAKRVKAAVAAARVAKIATVKAKIAVRRAMPAIAPLAVAQMSIMRAETAVATVQRTKIAYAPVAPPAVAYAYAQQRVAAYAPPTGSDMLLDALDAANLRGLSVNELISLRDHGVSPRLVTAAHQFLGSRLTPQHLVQFADHGVSPEYLQSLASAGLTNISSDDVVRLMEHGVDAHFIVRIRAYNPRASVDDIIHLRDSGF